MGASSVISQERVWDYEERRRWLDAAIEIEIRNDRTWSMDDPGRAALERMLRGAAPPELSIGAQTLHAETHAGV